MTTTQRIMKSNLKQLGTHSDATILILTILISISTAYNLLAPVRVEAFYLQLPDNFPATRDGNPSSNSNPVKFSSQVINVTALERKTAILICEVESDPRPTIYWYKDGSQINKKRLPTIKYNKGSILRIEPLKIDRDSGHYECMVETNMGEASRSHIYVRVINETDAPSGFPRIVNQPVAAQTVEVGGIASISCQASGHPAPNYAWLHDSIPIDIVEHGHRISLENDTIKINNVTEADKGGYLCIASNRLGTVTSMTSNLMVSLESLPEGSPFDLKFKLTSPNDVTISWSAPEIKSNVTITGYQVYFGKLGGATSDKQDIPDVLKMVYSDLSDNTEYAFRVRAKSKGGFGAYSETITFKTPRDSPPPPDNVQALANAYNSAMVWWDETAYFSGITGYRVYYSIHTNLTGTAMNEDLDRWQTKNVTLTSSVIITNLVENSYYDVRVCAVGLGISGKLSKTVKFRTIPEDVPYDLKTSDLTTHSVKLTWKPPLELVPSKYKITYDAPEKHYLDNKNQRQQISIPMKTVYSVSTQFSLQDLKPFTKYRINVTAVPSKESFRPPVTTHITTAMAAPKQMDEPTLMGPTASGREFELYLPLATEEYGPIGYYYVFVIPADMPTQHPDIYSIAELKNRGHSANGPYIAAKFPKSRMVTKFTLGDNKSYDGFLNRPLNKEQTYYVFVRAEVEHSETLTTNSPQSQPITLQPRAPPSIQDPPNPNFRKVYWILWFLLALVALLGVVVTLFYKKQRQALKTNQMNETTIRLLPDHMMDRIYSSVPIEPIDRKNMNYQSRAMQNHPPVPVNDLVDHIEFLKLNNNLKDEYESIEPGQQFTWENSYLDFNRSKNRYGNVVAYDHSRVTLTPIDGIPGSDYINANFCDGYQKPNHYIATQGPLPNTVGDFWRMVWEQNSRTIVMMTQLEERGRVKCVQYWPSRDSVTYHGITIVACSVEELAYYNIRTFRLQFNNEIREIRQFQFTAWPDHGVPVHPASFLMFLRRTKVSNPQDAGPMAVLCSAGVGRTGCFIVIDSMIERMKKENTIDIYGHVTSLRAQRNYIVQTEDQYMFIHDAVLEAAISANTEVPISGLSEHFNRLVQIVPDEGATGLELEFKRLASIKYSQKFISANLPVNKHKNRLMNILPYESTRVCLEPIANVDGSDYINASFCDGYRLRNAYITTQSPLPDTVEDMWRMLYEHNSGIIVMLTKLKELGREKCTQYWPAERYGDYGPFRITLNHEYDTSTFILREFTITNSRNPDYNRIIRQFHFTSWPEQGLPKSGESFINFIAEVHKTKQKFGIEGPITVHCSVGVGRTGVFVALSILLERLQNEGFVNLFETVRLLRTQRPGMVQTEDQYQFCYQTALDYVRSFEQ